MRKVLSFVLVLTLVLSSFSMAFAADATTSSAVTAPAATTATSAGLSDISASANSQAIQVANNLGIVTGNPDGTFQPEKTVTRAEFAAMITRALGIPQSALAGYTSTSFKDCSGYSWAVPYLAFCQSKGIMLGDGKGNAMPGKTINTNEAATMILRALGYTSNSSALVGIWPANYVSMAQDLGIYDDTASATNVDKQNAAQMIYNALTVQKVQVASDGTTKMLVNKDDSAVTMLTSGLGCTNEGYHVVAYNANSVINTIPYVGMYAKIYKNADGDIVAIDDVKSTQIKAKYKGTATTGGSIAVDDIFKDSNDVEYKIKQLKGSFGYYVYADNGDKTTDTLAHDEFVNSANKSITLAPDKEFTLNVKLENKNIAEVYSIMDWAPDAAAKVVAGDLTSLKDGTLLGFDFTQDKSDKIISKSFQLIGAKSLNDIKADNVVYVYKDADRKEISRVAVGTQVIEGTVTKVNATDKKWTVGGKVYAFAMNGENGSSKYKNELNNAVKLYLDAYGDIYKYDVTSGSAKDYATVVSYDTAGTSDGNMKLYMANDSKKTYSTDLDNWTGFFGTVKNTYGLRLIGYSLNKSGEVDGTYPKFEKGSNTPVWGDNQNDGWYTAAAGTAIMPSNTVLKNMVVAKVKNNVDVAGSTKRTLVVDPDAVVFTYDTVTANGTAPEVNGVSKVANIEKDASAALTGQVEVLVRDGKVVALIVFDADCSGSTTDSYAVVSAADQAVNSAGDKALSLTGFIDGKKMADDAVFTSGTGTVSADGATGFSNVNVYKLKYNDDKNISKMDAVTGAKVVLNGNTVAVNGYTSDNYIQVNKGASPTAIAADAVYYEVVYKNNAIDEYKIYNGTIYAGMLVYAYETNDDKDGADIVIINKNGISTYSDPTFKVTALNANVASKSAVTVGSITSNFLDDDSNKVNNFSIYDVSAGTGATKADFSVVLNGADPAVRFAGTNVTTPGAVTVTVQLTDKFGGTALESFSFTFTN